MKLTAALMKRWQYPFYLLLLFIDKPVEFEIFSKFNLVASE